MNKRIVEEWNQPTFGLLRLLRLSILVSRYASLTVLLDSLVGGVKLSTVAVSREFIYYIPRDSFFLLALFTSLHECRLVVWTVFYFVLDMLANLAGGTFIWGKDSLDPQRSLVLAMANYFEISVAFAVFYLHCNCLNVKPLCAVQALYFSLVTATTVGFGDLYPVGFHGQLLVISQLGVFVMFVLIFLATLQSRASARGAGRDT